MALSCSVFLGVLGGETRYNPDADVKK